MISHLEMAFAQARATHREAAWERVVSGAQRRGPLTSADWQWIGRQLAHADQLDFHSAESIARIVAADAREAGDVTEALPVLLRLTKHPADSVKGAALTAAADLPMPLAQWLAAQISEPRGPLSEIVAAIAAMTG